MPDHGVQKPDLYDRLARFASPNFVVRHSSFVIGFDSVDDRIGVTAVRLRRTLEPWEVRP